MNDLLPMFWPVLGAVDPVFTPRLADRWPDGALDRLVELGIANPMHDANYVVCPHCFDHEEEVIALEGPPGRIRYWIPCPDSFRVEISRDQLRQWTINITAVVAQFASSLQLVGSPAQVQSDLVWRLGRGTLEGYVHDFLFVRHRDVNEAELLSLCSTLLGPVILFQREVPRSWLQSKIPAASVRDVATCRNGRIEIDRSALAMLVSQGQKRPPANTFRRRGDFWELSFAGEPVHIKNSRGLAYIARLLSEPERDIQAVSLLAAQFGTDTHVPSGSLGEVLDDAARVSYSERYQELCDELEIATRHHDLGMIAKLQAEKDHLLSELARATGLGGRSRKQTDADKARRSVTMAVTRDLDRIRNEHAALGEHLRASIKMGLVFRYSPEGGFHWQTK